MQNKNISTGTEYTFKGGWSGAKIDDVILDMLLKI